MDLYLMRHGIAAKRGSKCVLTDRQRPLTKEGAAKVRKIAKAMKRMGLCFDLILSSPYPRALQTAEIVAEVLDSKDKLHQTDRLAVGRSQKSFLEYLNRRHGNARVLLLVGHEPFLSNLISLLLAGKAGLQFELRKGGLCHLTADALLAGPQATLHWLINPKQMTGG